ncbi:MAG: SusC/RagA family TonB-linked outer membrane protein [Bacteroidetes bacterium]|nr:SusC/RagA family TonB-linked outer membrane protein [Bacteroidota bacterium]
MIWNRLLLVVASVLLSAYGLGLPAAHAQTGTITGMVTEADTDLPLPGANVLIVGTSTGSVANVDGRYTISNVEPGTYALRASFVGYDPVTQQEVVVAAGETTEVSFTLQSGALLDELVVIGYGERRRNELTTSISSVSDEDIASRPLSSPEEALQGTVPGIVVTQNSGSPGQGFSVRIRGIGSPGNNEPLYVVDGLPVPDRPNYLNPSDIASIDVIKDAAGAAIYGTQGSNGVILITTKKGDAGGETVVDFNAQFGTSEVTRQLDMLEAAEYATLRNEAAINAGQAPVYADPAALRGQSTNWQDQIFQTGTFQKYTLGVSGGSSEFRFRVSGDFTDEEGIVRTSDFRQINFRINTEYTAPSDLFTVGENISIGRNFRNTVPEGDDVRNFLIQTLQFQPTEPVRDPSLNTTDNYTFSRFGNNAFNPVAVLDFNNAEDRATRLAGNVFGVLRPLEGLSIRSDFGLDLRYGDNYGFTPTYAVSPEFTNAINSVSRFTDRRSSLVWSNTATYNRVIDLHDVEVLAGTSAEWNEFEFISANRTGLPSDDPSLRYLQQGTESQGATGDLARSRLLSYFGRVNYGYNNRYLATLVARYDGSSRFGENNRYGFFPSFSLGWRISEEAFMADVDVVDELKLRGGYGINGNDGIGDFLFLTGIEGFRNYNLGPDGEVFPGATVAGSGNPDLKWEESRQTSLGLDATLLNSRLEVTIDYFVKNTVDLLIGVPQLSTSGAQRFGQAQNAGDIRNRGLELSLGWSDEALDGALTYQLRGNIATVANEVTSLGASDALTGGGYRQGPVTRTVVGQPIGSYYGYVTDGLFQTQDEVDAHAFQASGTAPGDIRFRDLNGDDVIDDADRTFIGNPFPDFTYGLNGRIAYQGFDLSLLLQGVSGNELFAAYEFYTRGSGIFNLEEEMLNRWTGPGTSTDTPRLTVNDPNQNTRLSDRYVRDGSYLRLKNVTLGYTLPARLFDALGASVRRTRLYVSGQNLLTFTGYDGLDPEIGERNGVLDRGIDRGVFPQARTITVGLDFQF